MKKFIIIPQLLENHYHPVNHLFLALSTDTTEIYAENGEMYKSIFHMQPTHL